ncbi:MAG: ATP-binding protein [Crocinitomicaceae bacterium]|nr:ATP-binding protein [Crocinitomicaceae bacterium]
MIINFSVQNFGSIKDKQTLSFEADKSQHLEDYFIINSINGLRLLKLGLIYGANASGKTSVLKALDFLRDLVLEPESKKTGELSFNPFLFDQATLNSPSILSIEFIQNETKYFYEIVFSKKAILKEELINYNPTKASVFKRTTDFEKQFSEIKFGSKITIDKSFKKTLESNTLWNNSVLGGFLKTNIELKELKEVTDWFSSYLKPIVHTTTELDGYVTSEIESSDINKKDVISILKKADFNISDIIINKEEKDIPDGLIDFLEKNAKAPVERVNELKNKGKITSLDIELEHTVNGSKYKLPFEFESQGTQRYYGFAGLLSLLIRGSISIPIDELESSLHPDLFTHFLLSFLINSKKSQLIATTHNREILNNKDIFRNDSIWFTNKNESCATELYSLSDFDSSIIRDTSNVYNAYKIGKLGGVPNLGDYYIDLDNEK